MEGGTPIATNVNFSIVLQWFQFRVMRVNYAMSSHTLELGFRESVVHGLESFRRRVENGAICLFVQRIWGDALPHSDLIIGLTFQVPVEIAIWRERVIIDDGQGRLFITRG